MTGTPDRPQFSSPGIDLERPSAARIYDWYLGGGHNFAVDREFGRRAVEQFPLIKPMALSNRRWLGRVVRSALQAGIRQFLDLGSGVPTAGNVHQIVAGTIGPGVGRVVYVDSEPVAVVHSQDIIGRENAGDWVGVVGQDLRAPEQVLAADVTRRLLDFSQPVCVIMASVLHFVGGDDDPADIIKRYCQGLAVGSWFAASHGAVDDAGPEHAEQVEILRASYSNTQNPGFLRDRNEFGALFGSLTLVDPGLVHAVDWRPDDDMDPDVAAEVRPFYWTAVGAIH